MNYKDVLLISEDFIKSESNLDQNISGNYLGPAIRLSQEIGLQSTIGTKLLESIQKKVYDQEINNPENKKYKEVLDYYIQPFLVYTVLSDIIIPISYKLSNFGVMKSDDEKTYNAEHSQINLLRQYYTDKADFFKRRLQYWIIDNYNEFPELYNYKPLKDMAPNLYSATSCGLWLGGIRSKTFMPKGGYLRAMYDFPSNKK